MKCCGKKPVIRTFDIPAHTAGNGAASWKAQTAYWVACPECGKSTSYSYGSEKEAEEAWDKGLIGKRH